MANTERLKELVRMKVLVGEKLAKGCPYCGSQLHKMKDGGEVCIDCEYSATSVDLILSKIKLNPNCFSVQ